MVYGVGVAKAPCVDAKYQMHLKNMKAHCPRTVRQACANELGTFLSLSSGDVVKFDPNEVLVRS